MAEPKEQPTFFKLKEQEKIKPTEKDFSYDVYINTYKMLQKLIYSKTPPNQEGKVTTENILNLNKPKKKKKKSKKKPNEPSKQIEEDALVFESKFDSGNLQLAYRIEQNQYQLFLHHDTNTTGYSQWFFFRVTNTKKGEKSNFAIMNLLRGKSKYCYGIKIWYYSVKANNPDKKGWQHTNEDVNYYKNNLYRIIKGRRQYFYTLSFDHTFEYDDDEVYFANCIPYTYTELMRELNEYEKYVHTKYPFLGRKTLCTTLAGNDLDYLIVNNSSNYSGIKKEEKEGIVLFARQHPSETVSSWTILGAIEFLLGNSDEARYLRDNFIFKIIPMMNPDGVICGNTRTSIAGCDLNRRWISPNELIHPEIFYAKEMIVRFSNQTKLNSIVDFHGHFGAFNSFFYANRQIDNFESCRLLPYTCAKKSKVISFERSRFSMPKYKRGTGRIDLFNEIGIENIFTLETSYFGCITGEYKNQYFTIPILKEIGVDICIGILLYHYNIKSKMGLVNLFNYPQLKKRVSNEVKKIENDFMVYCARASGIKEEEEKKEEEREKKREEKKKRELDENIDTEVYKEYEQLNEDESDNPENDEEDSESEPSFDNLEFDVIKTLLPTEIKKRSKKKKNKTAKYSKRFKFPNPMSYSKNKTIEQNLSQNLNKTHTFLPKLNSITTQNKPKEKSQKSTIEAQSTLSPFSKIKLCSVSSKITIGKNGANNYLNTDNKETTSLIEQDQMRNKSPLLRDKNNNGSLTVYLKVSSETQTEEIYFKMHWSYFIGTCQILGPKFANEVKRSVGLKNSIRTFTMQSYFNYGIKNRMNPPKIADKRNINDNKNIKIKYGNSIRQYNDMQNINSTNPSNYTNKYNNVNPHLNFKFNFYSPSHGSHF